MNYPEFLDYIKENILDEFENYEEYQDAIVDIVSVTKNNAINLEGITITRKEETVSPTIYINEYYENYLSGRTLSSIMSEIVDKRISDKGKIELEVENIYNYEEVKDKLIIRIVNYEMNVEQLKNCPYILFNDLAITFRWLAHQDEIGVATSLITNKELDKWNIHIDELYEVALANSERLFPSKLTNMKDLFFEYMEEVNREPEIFEDKVELYVLTNDIGINGASCLLYEDVLKDFAEKRNSDLYILPSSIHEVIVVPSVCIDDKEYLSELVESANKSVVGLMDILSDTVYYYHKCNKKITVA